MSFNCFTKKSLPAKHPFAERALKLRTGLMLLRLHGEKWLLFFLSPDVALANMMKFPSSPPGVHISGSCCKEKFQKKLGNNNDTKYATQQDK